MIWMVDAILKAKSQGKMIRFKHVLKQTVRKNQLLVRTKYLFIPKEHKTLYNGHIIPFTDQLRIRLSAQYHPNISTLQVSVAQVNQDSLVFDTERSYEFTSMKSLRAFVTRMTKRIQGFKRQPTLTIWARGDLFRAAASKAGTGRVKKRRK